MSKSQIEDVDSLIDALLMLDPKAASYKASVRAHCLGALSRLSTAKFAKAGDNVPRYGLTLTSKRRAISRYRNAIRERLGADHLALDYMKLKESDQESVHAADRTNIVSRHHGRRPLDVDRHIEIARAVLQRAAREPVDFSTKDGGTPPLEIAAALVAVTGRRPLEVLQDLHADGDFKPVPTVDPTLFDRTVPAKSRWTILFGGQRKTRDAEGAQSAPYEIPVLVEPSLVLTALAILRKRFDCVGMTSEQVGDKAWKNLGKYAKGEFASQESAGYTDRNGDTLNPKDLRAAYATCAYEMWAPRKVSWNAYTSRILGHSEMDLLTSFSYDVFFPWGSKKDYEREAQQAAQDTIAALKRSLKTEHDERTRLKIEKDIHAVSKRLEEG